jgi:hypothetical protein
MIPRDLVDVWNECVERFMIMGESVTQSLKHLGVRLDLR